MKKINVFLILLMILYGLNSQYCLSTSKLLNKNSKIKITTNYIPKYIRVGIVTGVPSGYAHYKRPAYVVTVPFDDYVKNVVSHEWWINNSLCNKEAIKSACVAIRTTSLWFYSDKYDLDDLHNKRAVNKIAANGKSYDIVSNAFRQVWLSDAYKKLKPYKKTLLDSAINETSNEIITYKGTNYLGYIQYSRGYYSAYKQGTNKISQKGTWWVENVMYKGTNRSGYNKSNSKIYLSILKYYLSNNFTVTNICSSSN